MSVGKVKPMPPRLTQRAKKIVLFAQEEAGRLGANYVSDEHLLLGLVRDKTCYASQILKDIGVSPEQIGALVERLADHREGYTPGDLPLTPRAKRVLDLADAEARQMKFRYIGTEHLLLGLIAEQNGLAARVLQRFGIKLERIREHVRPFVKPDEVKAKQISDEQNPFAKVGDLLRHIFLDKWG